mmetsp:Transcript_13928/g.27248  ORF Transcript_13928/g.27248 Transcript_13928/m.27248 type:complete len:213 (-) Transcript_13928:70-708(-)
MGARASRPLARRPRLRAVPSARAALHPCAPQDAPAAVARALSRQGRRVWRARARDGARPAGARRRVHPRVRHRPAARALGLNRRRRRGLARPRTHRPPPRPPQRARAPNVNEGQAARREFARRAPLRRLDRRLHSCVARLLPAALDVEAGVRRAGRRCDTPKVPLGGAKTHARPLALARSLASARPPVGGGPHIRHYSKPAALCEANPCTRD